MDKHLKRLIRSHAYNSRSRGKLTHQKIRAIRERYEIFRENWDEYMKINDAELAKKFDVNKDTIRYVCSPQYRGVRCAINDPEDVRLIRELHAEARTHKALAMKHNPSRLARDYGLGRSTVVHIGENDTYKGV
jgi:hypothetical protein